jgi:hypothetical protein
VIRASLIDGPGPLAQPAAVVVKTADEARRAVDDYAAGGYAAINFYGSLPPSLVPVVAERAKGLRVSGHIPAQMTAADAVREGYDEIDHIPCKLADLVLIDGDPATRISDIRRPTLVVARGRAYEPAKLLAALGIEP